MRRVALALAALAALAACGGVREVRTAAPVPAVTRPDTAYAAPGTFRLTLAAPDTLPPEVTALRLRVTGWALRPAGGRWLRRPADVRLAPGASVVLTDPALPLGRYDSLQLVLGGAEVAFGPGAVGPVEGAERVTLPVGLAFEADTAVALRWDPAAALVRDSTTCRWRLVPAFEVGS